MTWEIFKKSFLDRLFPNKMKEDKLVEFINLHHGGMSVHDYSLTLIQLSKYAPSLSYPRDEISLFVTGVSDDLQEECYSDMFHDNINIYRLMVLEKHVED